MLNGTAFTVKEGRKQKQTTTCLAYMLATSPSCNLLFGNLPIAVYATDNEGFISYYNRAAVNLWEKEPVLGKDRWCNWSKIFRSDGVTPISPEASPMALFLKEGKVPNHEEIIIETEKGNRKYVIPHPNHLLNDSGEIIGGLNMIVEITEKRMTEETRSRFESIVQYSSDGIISKNLDGYITSWNKSAERIFGYTEKEMVGQHITKIIPPERISEEHFILQKIRKGERLETLETQRLTKSGELLDISLTISPVRNQDGIIVGASKIVRNITRQKALQKKIEDSELLFKTVTNSSPAALWLTDPSGKTIFLSETWLKWTNSTFEEQINDGWWNELLPEDKVQLEIDFREAFDGKKDFTSEFRLKGTEEPLRWYRVEGKPYLDVSHQFAGYAGSITEITDMKELEQRKDNFIVMASHELRTPITSIHGYIQLLVNIFEETDKERLSLSNPIVRSSLDTVSRQVFKLTRLIRELLDLSRLQTNKMEFNKSQFIFNNLIEEGIEEARLTTSKIPIVFESEYNGSLYADRDRIGQVLLNLLSNAIKYSNEEGKITVSLRKEGKQVLLSVCDNGIGISKKDQLKIFDRFYRVEGKNEQTYPGFGIGLFIANEIVKGHGGSIKVKSRKGKETIFTVQLPIDTLTTIQNE